MFDMSDRVSDVFGESANEATENNLPLNIYRVHARMADGDYQKIFLPPGSGQSRFAPPSYYYLASKSGVTPSWVIDEMQRANSLTS
jgi:hypothetical protein